MKNETSPRRGRAGKLIALNLVIFGLVFGGLELYLRRTQSYIIMDVDSVNQKLAAANDERRFFVKYTLEGRRLVPNTRSRVMNHPWSGRDVEIRVNSMGFRGGEMPARHPPNQFRVLALGDSITLAPYLPEEETYVSSLQERLRELLPGREVLAFNAGVVDIGLKEEMDILEETGLSSEPDVVVVGFFLNDLRPPYGFPGEKQTPGWLRRHSVLVQYLFQRFELKKFLKDRGIRRETMSHYLAKDKWITDHDEFLRLAGRARMDWGSAWKDEPWTAADRELDRLARHRDQRGFKVVIAAFPVYFQVYSQFLDDQPQQILARKAAQRGFAFLDLLPAFRQNRGEKLFYDHCHLQPPGNRLAGRRIADFIAHEVVPP